MKQIMLEIERVFIGADEMRDQVFMRGAVIENFDVRGGLDEDFGVRAAKTGAQAKPKNKRSPATSAGLVCKFLLPMVLGSIRLR